MTRGTTALLLAALVAAAHHKAAEGPAAPYDSAWPQYSPDGRSIVFASTREDDDFEIYVMRADGSRAMRLTHAPGRDAHPIFSPDGKRILFQSPRAGGPAAGPDAVDLYVMDADGKNERPLIAAPGFDGVPSLSKDGKTLAYMHGTPEGDGMHWEIHFADPDGKNDRAITASSWSSQVPVFDPNGGRIALHANPETLNQVFLMDLRTLALSPLASGAYGSSEVPSFSPDGRTVAFTSTRDGPRDLYRVEVDTDTVTRLTTNMDVWSQASWSPDGRRILFSAKVLGHDEIFRIDANGKGGAPVRLTHGAGAVPAGASGAGDRAPSSGAADQRSPAAPPAAAAR